MYVYIDALASKNRPIKTFRVCSTSNRCIFLILYPWGFDNQNPSSCLGRNFSWESDLKSFFPETKFLFWKTLYFPVGLSFFLLICFPIFKLLIEIFNFHLTPHPVLGRSVSLS